MNDRTKEVSTMTDRGHPSQTWNEHTRSQDTAEASARQTAERLREKSKDQVKQVGERTKEGLDEGKRRVAARLRRVSAAIQNLSDDLPEDVPANRYERIARDRIERAARYVESTNIDRALSDLESVARRKPAWFFGGAFALGLFGARFLKSHREANRDGEKRRNEEYQPGVGDTGEYVGATPRAASEDLPLSTDMVIPIGGDRS